MTFYINLVETDLVCRQGGAPQHGAEREVDDPVDAVIHPLVQLLNNIQHNYIQYNHYSVNPIGTSSHNRLLIKTGI